MIGAQKAGSTHLADLLGRHPEIFMGEDEVPIFEDPFYGNSDPAELAAALAGAGPSQRRGIHRPDYLAHPEVPPRLGLHSPDARVVAVLREPVKRAISAYCWYVQFAMLPVRSVEEGLTELLDGWQDPSYPHAPEVLEYGLYGRHLGCWLEHFPREQLLVLTTDQLGQVDAQAELFDLLGVEAAHVEHDAAPRTNLGVYEPRRLRFLRARARFAFSWDSTDEYTYRPRRLRRPLGIAVAAAARTIDRQVLARLWGNDLPTLTPVLRERLAAYYADDAARVAEVLGRDPGWPPG